MIVAFVFGSIDLFDGLDITPIIPATWKPLWLILHPVVFAYLRYISTTPVGSREPPVATTMGAK